MTTVGIGLIGAGFMGTTHSKAYQSIASTFGPDLTPRLEIIADVNPDAAKAAAGIFGFKRWTTNWQDVVACPDVDLVDITTPNSSHCPIAIAAARAGKDVHCEKPLALDAAEAREATNIVEKAGVISSVGFNYAQNPIQAYVKSVIDSGELGRVVNFRGSYDQDYYAEDETLHTWRFLKSASASGALGDLASHTISLAQYLTGDINRVCGMTRIIVPERPDPNDPATMLPVENDDIVQFMYSGQNGVIGTIFSNRLACGRKMSLTYEIQMTRGCILFTQERQNEVQIYRHDDRPLERGFKTVLITPGQGEYAHFFNGAGIEIGYADLKTIEMYHAIRHSAEQTKNPIDFRFGCRVNMVIDAVLESAANNTWVEVI
ncbi:MAG: Gfo/Idh/MocA family oxidoreductase [Planctomycetaceae bacterium]|nr:Gfo/Idh/MocA family oxidoreductase [Planctomycetaceae bacterium]